MSSYVTVSLRRRPKHSANAFQSTGTLIPVLDGAVSLWSCMNNCHPSAWEHGMSYRKRAIRACSPLLLQESGLPLELMASWDHTEHILSRSRPCLFSISLATTHYVSGTVFPSSDAWTEFHHWNRTCLSFVITAWLWEGGRNLDEMIQQCIWAENNLIQGPCLQIPWTHRDKGIYRLISLSDWSINEALGFTSLKTCSLVQSTSHHLHMKQITLVGPQVPLAYSSLGCSSFNSLSHIHTAKMIFLGKKV